MRNYTEQEGNRAEAYLWLALQDDNCPADQASIISKQFLSEVNKTFFVVNDKLFDMEKLNAFLQKVSKYPSLGKGPLHIKEQGNSL